MRKSVLYYILYDYTHPVRNGRELVGMNRNLLRVLAGLLCLALLLAPAAPAFAEGITIRAVSAEEAVPLVDEPAATPEAPARDSILDSAAITEMVEDYLNKKNIPLDRVGVGYCYTATGDEWFYNGDTWFYPGSMYKVPLMMILAERIRDGQVDKSTQIGGLDLDTVFQYILVNSNNDYAHMVRKFLIDGQGGDEIWREEAKQYARLQSYDERYLLYCYFSPRYMTQVLETLYKDPDRFPGVTENLLKAEQAHYFRLHDEMHPLDIAQKYGSYLDQEGANWNHTAGIIYTDQPFILTVMTKNVGGYEGVIGDLAVLFKDYTLGVDEKLAAYQHEQEAKEAQRRAEEEAARLAEEQAQQAAAGQKPAQSAAQPKTPETQLGSKTADRYERGRRAGIIVLAILLVAAIVGGIAAVIIVKEKERRRYESFRRRFEAEMREEALEAERVARARQAQARREAPAAKPAPKPQTPPRPAAKPAQPVQRPAQPVQRPAQQAPRFNESLWEEDGEDE